MKRNAVLFALMILSMSFLLAAPFNIKSASAQSTGYSISHVDHLIEVTYSGHIAVEDTIQVNGEIGGNFILGFPYTYGPDVLKAVAYDSQGALPVSLGVQLQGQNGFYGASVSLPQTTNETFTVIFILSNGLLTPTGSGYVLDFPAYPSFVSDVSTCNVTLALPPQVSSLIITKPDGVVTSSSFEKDNLTAFTYAPATASFALDAGYISKIDIQNLDRQISTNPIGAMSVSDSYRMISNQASDIASLVFNLPGSASNVAGIDQLSRVLGVSISIDANGNQLANVTLITPLRLSETAVLTLKYTLPRIVPEQTTVFTLNLDQFSNLYYYVDKASITVTPPGGARFLAPTLSSANSSIGLNRGIFQQTLTINRIGVSFADSLVPSMSTFQTKYDFSPLWISFLPTIWIWALAGVGCVGAIIVKKTRAPSAPKIVLSKSATGISAERLEHFADTYEEKIRLTSELKSLDYRAQKGRIPRQRYKVQRRTMEVRLETLSKHVEDIKDLMRKAGGNYSELVRQLENAENNIDEADSGLKNIDARKSRGELSLEEYKKLQNDYQRRKEKAENSISGILLRLREELQ